MDQGNLLNGNPTYANMKYPSGMESTVSVCDFAPCPQTVLPQESSTMKPNKSPPIVLIQEEDTMANEDVTRV